jgi:hypothetical protein
MSIAWTTIAVLVLLLPGFVFIARLYSVERTARESSASPLAFLAGAIPAAFVIQVGLYLILHSRIDLRAVLAVLQLQGAEAISLGELAAILRASRGGIVGYVLLSGFAGYVAGWAASAFVRSGRLPFFIRHGLVRDLLVADVPAWKILYRESIGRIIHAARDVPATRAYVVTKVQHEGRVVMYEGLLRQFYFTSDGRIAYLVLGDCHRCYLDLVGDKSPLTSIKDKQRIGSSRNEDGDAAAGVLMIDGSDVANVYFEKGGTSFGGKDQRAYIEGERKKLDKDLSRGGVPESGQQPGSAETG